MTNIEIFKKRIAKKEIAEYIETELLTMFPNNGVRARVRNVIGSDNIYLRYTHYKTSQECSMGILENDPAFMSFIIWSPHANTSWIEFPTIHCNEIFKNPELKFRKINGKTEVEVADKLIAWFKKNRKFILNVPK